MSRKFLAVIVAVLAILSFTDISQVQAQVIGNGFTCDGTTILNKTGKIVPLAAAKRKIKNKIANLVAKNAAKSKIAALKKIKAGLVACSKGTFTPGGGNADVAGTYTGVLTRTSADGSSVTCDYDAEIDGSFVVEADGSGLRLTSSPFHIPADGSVKGGAVQFSGSTGSAHKTSIVVTLSNVTDSSGDISVVQKGSAFSPFTHKFVTICEVHWSGTGFVRVQ